jgi:hypothetical protein
MPNIKELGSLVDLSVTSGARIDPTAFPAAYAGVAWASSPYVDNASEAFYAWEVSFTNGYLAQYSIRDSGYSMRLVRSYQ